jgi:hypothetical protein
MDPAASLPRTVSNGRYLIKMFIEHQAKSLLTLDLDITIKSENANYSRG